MAKNLSHNRLLELLIYYPGSGLFINRIYRGRGAKAGAIAGCKNGDYVKIKVDGKAYSAHRLAWLYMTGGWPDGEVDHIDHNPTNNTWLNLRIASHGQNQANSKVYNNNVLGLKGVSRRPNGKYVARIRRFGKEVHLGVFSKIEEAQAAYWDAAKLYHGDFARIG